MTSAQAITIYRTASKYSKDESIAYRVVSETEAVADNKFDRKKRCLLLKRILEI